MALHFTATEFATRRARLLAAMAERRLDGLLLFAQESHFWLTGYDTFGFCFFQCLYVAADGRMALLTRSADLRQAQHTSTLADIRIWRDAADADPTREAAALVVDLGGKGARIGVEFDSYGLTHFNGRRLEASLAGIADMVDASDVVPRLRAVKSAEEIACVRLAARLSDAADTAALGAIRAGARSLPPSTRQSSLPVATIRATSSSSARAAMHCCAATSRGGENSMPTTRSRWSLPGPGVTTTRP